MSICTKDKNSRQTRKNIFQIECSCGKSLLDKIIQERFSISKSVAAPRAQVVQNSFYPARHCRPSLHSNFSALKTDKAGKFSFPIGEIGGDFRRRAAVAIVALVPLIWSFDSETLSSSGSQHPNPPPPLPPTFSPSNRSQRSSTRRKIPKNPTFYFPVCCFVLAFNLLHFRTFKDAYEANDQNFDTRYKCKQNLKREAMKSSQAHISFFVTALCTKFTFFTVLCTAVHSSLCFR